MNKVLRVILPLALLCGILAGCGGGNKVDPGTGDPGGSRQEETDQEKREYVPGERTDTGFSSEWMGLRYTLGGDMVMATDEEINSMMELGADIFSDGSTKTDLMLELAQLNVVYEMMAVNVTDQSNITVCVEKLALSGMTESQYLAAVKTQMEQGYVNYTVTYREETQRDICGISFTEMGYSIDYSGAALYQTYLVKKIDDRMVGIVLSYTDEAALDALLSGFSAF